MNWFILALITAMTWGCLYASTEQVTKFVNPKTYLTISCFFSAIIFTILGCLDGSLQKDLYDNNLNKCYWFIFLSSLCSFIASLCSVIAVKYGGATYASIVEISYPFWVVIFLFLITGKNNLNWNVFIGGTLIFIGTIIVLLRK